MCRSRECSEGRSLRTPLKQVERLRETEAMRPGGDNAHNLGSDTTLGLPVHGYMGQDG